MNIIRRLCLLVVSLCVFAGISRAEEPVKTVYQFSGGLEQASRGLANIRHHVEADPNARIVVVALGSGVDFLLEGAADKNGNVYRNLVDDLSLQGVEFRVCANTLHLRGIDRKRLIAGTTVVPAGVAEIARLQFREHYAYIKP